MSRTIILDKDCLKFPKNLLKEFHLQNGQKLIIETTPDNAIRIKPVEGNSADMKLLQFLENPVHMGKIKYKDREEIYGIN